MLQKELKKENKMSYFILSGTNQGIPMLIEKGMIEDEPEAYTEDHTALFDTKIQAEIEAETIDICQQCGYQILKWEDGYCEIS